MASAYDGSTASFSAQIQPKLSGVQYPTELLASRRGRNALSVFRNTRDWIYEWRDRISEVCGQMKSSPGGEDTGESGFSVDGTAVPYETAAHCILKTRLILNSHWGSGFMLCYYVRGYTKS